MANDLLREREVNHCVEPRACYLFPAPTRVRVRMRFREPWQHLASLCNDFDTTRHDRLAIAHRATCRHHKTNAAKNQMQGLGRCGQIAHRVHVVSDR